MYLSQSNIDCLRHQVEEEGGFHLAIAPMFPHLFPNVWMASEALYQQLSAAGYRVLLDDRNQRPGNMFEVIEFLGIRHRVVISSRSISAKVLEYRDLQTGEFQKVSIDKAGTFLVNRVVL